MTIRRVILPLNPTPRQQSVHTPHARHLFVVFAPKQRQPFRLDQKSALLWKQPRRPRARAPEPVKVSSSHLHHLGSSDGIAPNRTREITRVRSPFRAPRLDRRAQFLFNLGFVLTHIMMIDRRRNRRVGRFLSAFKQRARWSGVYARVTHRHGCQVTCVRAAE